MAHNTPEANARFREAWDATNARWKAICKHDLEQHINAWKGANMRIPFVGGQMEGEFYETGTTPPPYHLTVCERLSPLVETWARFVEPPKPRQFLYKLRIFYSAKDVEQYEYVLDQEIIKVGQ